jgi:succinoglycan biosynthesis transport protein ExoP
VNQITPKSSNIGVSMVSMAASSADNELREWLRLLNRRKAMIIGVGLVVVALTALILAQLAPLYRASARVMLDTRKFKMVNTEAALSGVDTFNGGALQTELEIIKSEDLLGRVVDRLGLASNPDFNGTRKADFVTEALAPVRNLWSMALATLVPVSPQSAPAPIAAPRAKAQDSDPRRGAAIGTIASRLTATLVGRTFIILITVESPNGTASAQIANAIADMYLVDQLDAKYEANKRATEWLEERLGELRRSLQAADDQVATYRRDKGMTGSPEGSVSTQTLNDLNAKYTAARARRIEREARLVALRRASVNPSELANITEVTSNATLAALRIQDVELGRRVAELSEKLGDNHPRLIQARNELATVRGRFAAETQRIAVAIQAELEAARSEEEQLKVQVERASSVSGETSQYEAELKQLEREAQSSRTIYESFLNRFKELREQQDIQRPDARILSYARPSSTPSFPQYQTALMLAFAIGCALGMGGAIAFEKLDRGFRSATQIEKATGLAVLGMIPLVKGARGARSSAVSQVILKPTSAASEALRAVYTAITLGTLDQTPRIIAVTSATPGEGKTTFTAALGSLLTKMNASRRVLIVDLDLRQARLADAFEVKDRRGTIDEFLLGTKSLEECVHVDAASGVHFICARSNTPNAPDVLESEAMKNALANFCERYDLVILDSPPVMAVSDARIISRLADYTIFLVYWAATQREVVTNAINLLRTVSERVGIVINKVDLAKHVRYGYGDYGYYYSRYRSYYGMDGKKDKSSLSPRAKSKQPSV